MKTFYQIVKVAPNAMMAFLLHIVMHETRQSEKISGKDKTAENKEMIVAYITAQETAKTSELAEHIGLSQPRVGLYYLSL